MQKKIISVLAAGSVVFAACGDESSSSDDASSESASAESSADCAVESLALFAEGRLTAATGEPVYSPWMVDDDPTNGQGYESAFVYELADRLGFVNDQVDWVRTTFDEAIRASEKDYDFNLQQYTITEERDEIVDFSAPYYTAQRVVMAIADSDAASATSFSELRDVKWAATVGTNDLAYIEDVIGVDSSNIAVFNNQADTQAAMLAGQADATVVNLPSAYYLTAVEIPEATISGVLPDGGEGTEQFGMIFDEGSELKPCVDAAITAMTDDGTLASLAEEHLQGAGEIPTITED